MSLSVVLLSHEQRDELAARCAGFTCRGPRHKDDPTTDHGDAFLCEGLWADADEMGVTRTWLAVFDGEVAGYVALAASSVHLTKGQKKKALLHERPVSFRSYGCTQIVMLATRADFQERQDVKFGRALVDHAILVGQRQGEQVGSRFLIADVNPPAVAFYEKCGFDALGKPDEEDDPAALVPMFYDLNPKTES